MSESEIFATVEVGGDETIDIYVIESPGTNPPKTNHYDLQFVTGVASFTIPGLSISRLEQIGEVIESMAFEIKGGGE